MNVGGQSGVHPGPAVCGRPSNGDSLAAECCPNCQLGRSAISAVLVPFAGHRVVPSTIMYSLGPSQGGFGLQVTIL
jgi:hypothetical protein